MKMFSFLRVSRRVHIKRKKNLKTIWLRIKKIYRNDILQEYKNNYKGFIVRLYNLTQIIFENENLRKKIVYSDRY